MYLYLKGLLQSIQNCRRLKKTRVYIYPLSPLEVYLDTSELCQLMKMNLLSLSHHPLGGQFLRCIAQNLILEKKFPKIFSCPEIACFKMHSNICQGFIDLSS